MPLNAPAAATESDQLLAFLAHQRAAVINACHGLDEAQARLTPLAGSLSVGGLVKHLAYGEEGWTARLAGPLASDDPASGGGMEAYFASFALTDAETLDGALAAYRQAAAATDAAFAGADLDRPVTLASAPWLPQGPITVRWVLVHLIEETARHAGHADLLRESLDGATGGPLMAAVEGWPEDGWITPWRKPA